MDISIEIIRNLALKNPKLCAWVGGFQVLTSAIINPSLDTHSH